LIDSQGDNPSPAAATHWTYTYDPIGNRTQSQYGPEGSEETTTYVANKLNQYPKLTLPTSQPAYQGHDADGNLTSEYGVKGGDSDCNGAVDFDDINYFVAALVSEASWVSYYKAHHDQQEPPCDYIEANDANGDHAVNFSDINPFVALIVNGAGDTARRYYYDAENRLLKFVLTPQAPESGSDFQEFYGYDYLGRRVFKQVDIFVSGNPVTIEKRRFIWDGWKLLEELDVRDPQAPAIARQYTWGLDLAGLSGAVNSLEGAGTIGGLLAVAQAVETHEAPNAEPSVTADDAGDFLFFYDGNGNVGQLVNWKNRGTELNPDYAWADARLAAAYEYDPYGAVSAMKGWDTNASPPALTTSGPIVIANRFRFSTKYFDANSGLHYFGYRYYSPRLGRWMSRDPIEENGGANLYAYVANRAVTAIDPLGLTPPEGFPPDYLPQAVAPPVDKTKACCLYSEQEISTGMDVAIRNSSCYKEEKCPTGATDPTQCCQCACSDKSPWHSFDRILIGASWGKCCLCTLTIKRDSWWGILPHHELEIECPKSAHGDGFVITVERWAAENNLIGRAKVIYGRSRSARPFVSDQMRIPCEMGQALKRELERAYPKSSSGRNEFDYEWDILIGKNCRSFAYYWYNYHGEWRECGK